MDDNFNGKNNVVTVKKSDFEVMDALAMDIQNQAPKSITNSEHFISIDKIFKKIRNFNIFAFF